MLHYQPLTADQGQNDPKAAVAQIANTVARPGPLTTEWWTVLIAGAVSSVLALVGLPGPAAAQVAGIVAPIVIALVYAFVRAQTKGALADALKAIFPQTDASPATGTPAGDAAVPTSSRVAAIGSSSPASTAVAGVDTTDGHND